VRSEDIEAGGEALCPCNLEATGKGDSNYLCLITEVHHGIQLFFLVCVLHFSTT
jgi:hypothetical protein